MGPWFEDFQGRVAFKFSNLLEHREKLCSQLSCRDISMDPRSSDGRTRFASDFIAGARMSSEEWERLKRRVLDERASS